MIALLQRVAEAAVSVDGRECARIGPGLLVLVGVQQADGAAQASRLAARILDYRVFPDEADRMNRSLRDVRGGLILVPQFTLAADTGSGTRPGFSTAAPPDRARELFDAVVTAARAAHGEVGTGIFGAHMRVSLVNDGPVTFWLTA
mgnify:CR=1 FL=1